MGEREGHRLSDSGLKTTGRRRKRSEQPNSTSFRCSTFLSEAFLQKKLEMSLLPASITDSQNPYLILTGAIVHLEKIKWQDNGNKVFYSKGKEGEILPSTKSTKWQTNDQ
jgi:hypothetical protein